MKRLRTVCSLRVLVHDAVVAVVLGNIPIITAHVFPLRSTPMPPSSDMRRDPYQRHLGSKQLWNGPATTRSYWYDAGMHCDNAMKHPCPCLNLVLGLANILVLPRYTLYQHPAPFCFLGLPSASKILLLACPIQTSLSSLGNETHETHSIASPRVKVPEFGQSPEVPKEIWDEARSQLRVRLREIEDDGKEIGSKPSKPPRISMISG